MSALQTIKTPHLPKKKVGLLALGERYREKLAGALEKRGVEPLWLPDNPRVDSRLAGHADLSLMHLGDDRAVAANEMIVEILTNRGFSAGKMLSRQGEAYPLDCALNGCIVGGSYIHNIKVSDRRVLDGLEPDINIINVNQGYAKCSVCVVDERSVITSDEGIAKRAIAHGIDALLISPGAVELPGFKEGFIGGCAFKLSIDVMAFTGTFDGHPDKQAMLDFLSKREIRPDFLTTDPVFDIGSAIPLLES